MWYSFPLTPSLGLHVAVFRVTFHFEPSDHPFPQFHPEFFFIIFHRKVSSQHVGLHPRRLVHPRTAWYSFPVTPSLGSHIAVFIVPLHFEPSDHPFPRISPLNIHSHFIESSLISTSDFISVVWFTRRPCGTHFLLPHHLAYILQSLESPSICNPPTIHFPQFHPEILAHISSRGPPQHVGFYPRRLVHLKTVWYSFPFTPSLGLHIAVFRIPLHFEPSDHPFPPISLSTIYPVF